MNYDMQVWFIILVVAALASVTMQAIVLLAVIVGITRLYAKVKQIEAKLLYHGAVIINMTSKARDAVDVLMRMGHNVAEISDRIKGMVDEAAKISSKQLGRADQVANDVLSGAERLSDYIEQSVSQPLREFKAISAGLRTALALLFQRSGNAESFREEQQERRSTFDHRKAG